MTDEIQQLSELVDRLAATPSSSTLPDETLDVVETLLSRLEEGRVRAAERAPDGTWRAVPWVKRGILLGFRVGRMSDMSVGGDNAANDGGGGGTLSFVDKHTYPPRRFSVSDGVRVVPGGSSIRRGAHIARGVVCMPPMYVNVGAYVAEGTMVDSHVLVGSCAQIGARVHLSAAAQIGGVLEPVNATPVVIEDEVLVGGNCGVFEGTVVRERAVLAAGVVLTRGTPVFDLVRETVYRADAEKPLEIPAGAVVVPGARAVRDGWGMQQGLSLQTPVIVKYRDAQTDLATALESWLR